MVCSSTAEIWIPARRERLLTLGMPVENARSAQDPRAGGLVQIFSRAVMESSSAAPLRALFLLILQKQLAEVHSG